LAAKLDLEVGESLLTIVVPVHNMSGRLANLSKWLDEAHAQNVKVILVHDESQDSTRTELLQLLEIKKSLNFLLLEANVQSPGLARNLGLEIVDTPWFSFVDSDDFVYVSSIIKLIGEVELSRCEIGIGSYISSDLRSGAERVVKPPDAKLDAIALHLVKKMGLWRFVFSTKFFGDIRFTKHKMGEDYLYTNLVLNRTNQIFTSSQIVYKYFHGGRGNLTSNQSVMSEMIGIVKLIKNLEPVTRIAVAFKAFAIQKLTLSVLKNLTAQERLFEKFRLLTNLISHPMYLVRLLVSLKSDRNDLYNE
jgi:glycosyltransferase involved in cell wall biosynthesis